METGHSWVEIDRAVQDTTGVDALHSLRTTAGVDIPPLVFGTASLGGGGPLRWWRRSERRRAFRLLDEVFEAGCRGLDLARSYGMGGVERIVGEWLRQSGCREKLFIVSKIAHPFPVVAPNRLESVPLKMDLSQSLESLGIDQLDLLLLHRDHPQADLRQVASDLAGFRSRGLTRYTGVSNWRFERIEALNKAGQGPLVDVSSPQLSLAEWKAPMWSGCWSISGRKHRYERRQYGRTGLRTLAYCPLGRGFFGKGWKTLSSSGFRLRVNLERRRRAEIMARQKSATLVQIALAYLLHQPFPVFPVVGVSRGARMRENLAAARIALNWEECLWLERGEVT